MRRSTSVFLVSIVILLGFLSCRVGSPKKRISVFNDCKPEAIETVSDQDLIKDWFFLPVTSGEDAFNPVYIPFTYTCRGGTPDTMQYLTFPALLSFKFDFVPDNNSTRHPAFVFARDFASRTVKMTDSSDQIANYIKSWHATYAIGGELVQSTSGYSGSLVVFDKNGKEVLRKRYPESQPYFTLMGKIVRDWMIHAGWTVTDALWTELIRPMTSDMDNLSEYGKVFSVEHRSRAEWDIYEDILKRDPDFAEIRFWYTNQRTWQTGERIYSQLGLGRALASHLVMRALVEFNKDACTDPRLIDTVEQRFSYALRLFPEGHGWVLSGYIDRIKLTEASLDSMLPYAKKLPGFLYFLRKLASYEHEMNRLETAIPLCLSGLKSNYLPSSDEYAWSYKDLGIYYSELGYLDEGDRNNQQAFMEYSTENQYLVYASIAKNLRERFLFAEASEWFLKSFKRTKDHIQLLAAYMCLYEAGKPEMAKKLMEDQTTYPFNAYDRVIIQAREAIVDGKLQDAKAIMDQLPFENVNIKVDWRIQEEAELVKADIALLMGDKKSAYRYALNSYYLNPRSRRTLYLAELSASDVQDLGTLFSVANHMFPLQSYWRNKYQGIVKRGFKDMDENNIQRNYHGISEWYFKAGENKSGFWLNASPFFNEYLCLRMAQSGSPEERNEGLSLYLVYHKDMKIIFPLYASHSRAFMMTLINTLPAGERTKWKKQL